MSPSVRGKKSSRRIQGRRSMLGGSRDVDDDGDRDGEGGGGSGGLKSAGGLTKTSTKSNVDGNGNKRNSTDEGGDGSSG